MGDTYNHWTPDKDLDKIKWKRSMAIIVFFILSSLENFHFTGAELNEINDGHIKDILKVLETNGKGVTLNSNIPRILHTKSLLVSLCLF